MEQVRFIGGIASRITLLDEAGRPVTDTARSCWARSLTPVQVVVSCGKRLPRGENLVVQLAEIGGFFGRVDRAIDGGGVIRLQLEEAAREKLAAKISWYRKRVLHGAPEHRSYKRWKPTSRQSTVLMADGSTVDCTLIDVSATGVAVSTPLKPNIGLPLAVGQLVGKVVRHLDEGGFAVQFLSVQDESTVEKLLQPL
ncbi:PilZ domain-containing protein [Devosia submarina]|uniref:PilZ domain-containing protein n=1 Tax=Devosia submarina TaxID=1173082 RepID=UPI000D333231|nr:PilZ domain-containing protein [Devosia submarina]